VFTPLQHKGSPGVWSISDPAAGANFDATLSEYTAFEILAIHYRLATDATVTNRRPGISFQDVGTDLFQLVCDETIPASQTIHVVAFAGMGGPSWTHTNYCHFSLPTGLILKGNDHLQSLVVGLQAGDAIDQVAALGRAWPLTNPLS